MNLWASLITAGISMPIVTKTIGANKVQDLSCGLSGIDANNASIIATQKNN